MTPKRLVIVVAALAGALVAAVPPRSDRSEAAARPLGTISHIVVIYQENHSFDNVLGVFCVTSHRCDGTSTGQLSDGSTIPLAPAPDIVSSVPHTTRAQDVAIADGAMNGFDL